MILGRVVGQVWATKKNSYLVDKKLLIVQPLTWYNPDVDTDHLVCVDEVGAQVGEDVVVCLGAPGRWVLGDIRHPVDASIAAIVDSVELYDMAMRDANFAFPRDRKPAKVSVR